MSNPINTFQTLLRELFQFDCADLDFGIYRIMNHKRDVMEQFIADDLPKAIAAELDSGALAEQAQAAKELEKVAQQIKSTLASDALDADGNLVKFQDADIGKKYLALKAKAAGGMGRDLRRSAHDRGRSNSLLRHAGGRRWFRGAPGQCRGRRCDYHPIHIYVKKGIE